MPLLSESPPELLVSPFDQCSRVKSSLVWLLHSFHSCCGQQTTARQASAPQHLCSLTFVVIVLCSLHTRKGQAVEIAEKCVFLSLAYGKNRQSSHTGKSYVHTAPSIRKLDDKGTSWTHLNNACTSTHLNIGYNAGPRGAGRRGSSPRIGATTLSPSCLPHVFATLRFD